jgi:hypothetical protein
MVMGYSRNLKAAKDLLRWGGSRTVYEKWFLTQTLALTRLTRGSAPKMDPLNIAIEASDAPLSW